MAAVASPADQAADLLKNMSLDAQSKTLETSEPAKKPSVESGNNGNIQNQPFERSLTPIVPDTMDPTLAYYHSGYPSPAYYYGGYDGGATNDWDDYSRYANPDGLDLSHGAYGDNGSLMFPGYGYTPYGPYSPAGSPVPTATHDGQSQLYGAQHYQYPTPYFQPMAQSPAVPPKGDISRSTPAVQDTKVRPPVYQNSVFNRSAPNSFQGFDGPIPWIDGPIRNNTITPPLLNTNGFSSKNQNVRPHSHLMSPRPMSGINAANAYMNRMYPSKLYNQYGNNYSSYGNGWMTVDNKYKPRGRGNGFLGYTNENIDGLNELNRGPRARITRPRITISVKGQNGNLENLDGLEKICAAPDKDQYNKTEFPETYEDAKFFIIKSYSEDDVHKSIKYNVWSSTQNGNKKLDAAYQEAQQKPGHSPVFLFFSVNTSGQFVGVAEMVGPVDFNKSLEYWQQDKWIGCFPVKWHIVKDVPNTLLKHIILENNENKPVTNSRDTQEVKLDQGLQMIKIFKDHSSKQCILDDFEFYEDRQKRIQEKKAKQQQFHKQTWEEKLTAVEKKTDDVETHDAKTTVNGVVANGC